MLPSTHGTHMTKSDLINALAGELKISLHEASLVTTTVLETMTEEVCRGEAVEVRGFGGFVVKHYDGCIGRNPQTGKKIEVKSKKLPFLKVGKEVWGKVDEGDQDQQ